MSSTNCSALASALSSSYRKTDPFFVRKTSGPLVQNHEEQSSRQLKKYLSTHGILLTMCFPLHCTLPFGSTHISGSWINAATGVQIIPSQSNIGLILDPLCTKIECLFPTDGDSDGRNRRGCGPARYDPQQAYNAQHPWRRSHTKATLTKFKNMNFGVDTPWDALDCRSLFPVETNQHDTRFGWDFDHPNKKVVTIETFYTWVHRQQSAVMGHSVCNISQLGPLPKSGFIFFYSGVRPWKPLDWQAAMNWQLQFLNGTVPLPPGKSLPDVDPIWNEVVMALPRQMQDLVLGVFFLQGHGNGESVRRAANDLGGKPVLVLRPNATIDEDVLICEEG